MVRRTRPGISRFRVRAYARPGMTFSIAVTSRRQRLHLHVKIGFSLKADARQIRHGDVTVLDADAVGETAIGLEQIGIALIAAEAETGRDVQRHLMAAMGNASARRPAQGLQNAKRALIFAEPVGQRAVEL